MASAMHRSLSAWQAEAPLTGPAQQILHPKHCSWSWGDGSVAMRTSHSEALGLIPYWRAPGLEAPAPSSGLHGYCLHIVPIETSRHKHIYINKYSPQSHTHHTLLYLSTPKHGRFTFNSESFRLNHAGSHSHILDPPSLRYILILLYVPENPFQIILNFRTPERK